MSEGLFDYEVIAEVRLIVTADTPTDAEEQATMQLEEVCSDINILKVL